MSFDLSKLDLAGLIRAPLARMSDEEAVDCAAHLIDRANEERSEPGITRAFGMLKEIARRRPSPGHQALLHYFRANAWMARRVIAGETGSRTWEQPSRQQQILALLTACHHDGFGELDAIRRCQILTNLGIQLNEVGRFVEAIELWDRALAILPNFAMANGSRGDGLSSYGRASEDRYDLEILLLFAHKSYTAAISTGALWDSLYPPAYKAHFRKGARQIARHLDLAAIAADLGLDGASLGRGKAERAYRRWCLQNRLFLNPLNDLGARSIAASDYLLLPSLRVGLEVRGMPPVIGLYNQMKQEYAFARLLLYEGRPFCLNLLLPFAAMGAAIWAWSWFVERRSLATLGLTGTHRLRNYLAGLAIGIGMMALAIMSIRLAGGYVSKDLFPAFASPASLFWIAILLACFVVQSAVEEFIFRGWLLSTATRRWNLTAGFIASSSAFTFLHFSPHQPVREIVMAFTFGMFACAWAWRAGSIWGVMGWHAGWNWFTGVGFAVPITGFDLHLPALIMQLTPSGPDFLTGGPAGPESSVLTIGLLAAAAVVLLVWPRGSLSSTQRTPRSSESTTQEST